MMTAQLFDMEVTIDSLDRKIRFKDSLRVSSKSSGYQLCCLPSWEQVQFIFRESRC